MTEEQQKELYMKLNELLCDEKIVVKQHPEDKETYEEIFKNAVFLPNKIPIEIMITLFEGKPKQIISFSSTSTSSLNSMCDVINFSERYKEIYDFNNEYLSIKKILNIHKFK